MTLVALVYDQKNVEKDIKLEYLFVRYRIVVVDDVITTTMMTMVTMIVSLDPFEKMVQTLHI